MNEQVLKKLSKTPPAELCREREIELDDSVLPALEKADKPMAFLRILLEGGAYESAISYLANAMSKREAVWWACLCTRNALGDAMPDKEQAALKAAEAWAQKPDDDRRRAAMEAADAAGMKGPASMIAAGAFFSGGSVTPPDVDPVEAKEEATGALLAGAVLLAAGAGTPEELPERARAYIAKGIELASGSSSGRGQG